MEQIALCDLCPHTLREIESKHHQLWAPFPACLTAEQNNALIVDMGSITISISKQFIPFERKAIIVTIDRMPLSQCFISGIQTIALNCHRVCYLQTQRISHKKHFLAICLNKFVIQDSAVATQVLGLMPDVHNPPVGCHNCSKCPTCSIISTCAQCADSKLLYKCLLNREQ